MPSYSTTLNAAGAAYPATADATIPFEARRVILGNKDATNDAFVAFGDIPDGVTVGTLNQDEYLVAAGQQIIIDFFGVGKPNPFAGPTLDVRVRAAAGTPAVVLNATLP